MKVKASLPKGTRDFGPEQVYKRNYIFGVIREVFEKYGFQPIETPAMENLSTLTGNYGEEGDKLLFRILNSGDPFAKFRNESGDISDFGFTISDLCEKGLRYDLTIPFARYVVQHQNDITFPFKRYQMQPVWRADRPQRGRYREFYQCDVDVIGSDSLLDEVELIQIYCEVFGKLGINATIKINHRGILAGIAKFGNVDVTEFSVVLDKLDKIGLNNVLDEFHSKGYENSFIEIVEFLILEAEDGDKQINVLNNFFNGSLRFKSKDISYKNDIGTQATMRIFNIQDYVTEENVKFDFRLARGLDYYTGTIFEVKAEGVNMGSIGGGGRYDNLTGVFGMEGVSGVGVSFGVERLYDIMEELNLFPKNLGTGTQALFINFGGASETTAFKALQEIRRAGIASELYPSPEKMKKQMKYADAKKIPYVIFIGEEELKSGRLSMKNMKTGEQKAYALEEVVELLKR